MRQHKIRRRTTVSYDAANFNINSMERAVVCTMVPNEGLTKDDLLEWLVEPKLLADLRRLNQLVYTPQRAISLRITAGMDTAGIDLDFSKIKVLPPMPEVMRPQIDAPSAERWNAVMGELVTTVTQHTKLRYIVNWFTVNAVTPGAARYYFPSLQSLLPPDHEFFKVSGDRHKEIHLPLDIVDRLREAPEIIARGLLCDPKNNGQGRVHKFANVKINDGPVLHQLLRD